MNAHPIILDDVTIRFAERTILSALTFALTKNVATVVLGNSGSGKSMMLKCAAGLVPPDTGHVYYEGQKISSMNIEEFRAMQTSTGFHFQDGALWANRTLKENLSMPLLVMDPTMTDAEVEERVTESLASVGMEKVASLRPEQISMGHRKLVSFLRATIHQPGILFLDDPDSYLDHVSWRQLNTKVSELKEAGITLVMATYNREICEDLADEAVVLSNGRLVATGQYRDVIDFAKHQVDSVQPENAMKWDTGGKI